MSQRVFYKIGGRRSSLHSKKHHRGPEDLSTIKLLMRTILRVTISSSVPASKLLHIEDDCNKLCKPGNTVEEDYETRWHSTIKDEDNKK